MANLLTQNDKEIFSQISNGEDSIHKQRAKALLLIDNGTTQQKAGDETGLSIGQVRYCFRRYKNMGINIFPQSLRDEITLQTIKEEVSKEKKTTTIKVIKKDPKKKEKTKKKKQKKVKVKKEEKQKDSKKKETKVKKDKTNKKSPKIKEKEQSPQKKTKTTKKKEVSKKDKKNTKKKDKK